MKRNHFLKLVISLAMIVLCVSCEPDPDRSDNDTVTTPTTWYKDTDNDRYSDGTAQQSTDNNEGYYLKSQLVATLGDCNDNNSAINPSATDICNDGIDQNCDGYDCSTEEPTDPENLLVNGDFSYNWSTGWEKEMWYPDKGSFSVTNTPDGQLHAMFSGKNLVAISQTIDLPEDKTVEGLCLSAEVKLIPTEGSKFMKFLTVAEATFMIRFLDKYDKRIAEIRYSNNLCPVTQDTIIISPKCPEMTADRCIEYIGDGYHKIEEDLYPKLLNCTTGVNFSKIRRVALGGWANTTDPGNSVEIFIDNVRLFYK